MTDWPKLDKSLDPKVTDGPQGSIQVPSYASDVASLDTKLDKSLDSRKGMWVVKNPAALGKRAFVDWHNTFEVGEAIPESHIEAIQLLQQKGWYVFLACFCGPKREQKVRITLATLRITWLLMRWSSTGTPQENWGRLMVPLPKGSMSL